MHILILGAAGMIGRKLTNDLVADGLPGGPIDRLTLIDVVEPAAPAGFGGLVTRAALDLSAPGAAATAIRDRPDLIFHLAAIVSGEAEADLEKGYRVNLDGTRLLLDAIRAAGGDGWRPRLVFSSSIAVFGGDLPDIIPDDFRLTPATSYGAQKAAGELLVSDYSRRGFVDGISLRLPTICVRPGKPNLAASGFFSGIIREPLAGLPARLPVSEDVTHWFASPRAAIGFLRHAATLDLSRLGIMRALTMPGLSATVAEEIAALEAVAGPKATALIERRPDPVIAKIVAGWARGFDTQRAHALGFVADASFQDIVRQHIEDELGGSPPISRG